VVKVFLLMESQGVLLDWERVWSAFSVSLASGPETSVLVVWQTLSVLESLGSILKVTCTSSSKSLMYTKERKSYHSLIADDVTQICEAHDQRILYLL